MIIPLEPSLEGLAERRFFSFARQMLDRQLAGDQGRISALVEAEAVRAPELRELKGQCGEYTACVRVLGDLAQLRWKLVESGHGLELHSPRPQDNRTSTPCEVRRRKEAIRNELRPRVLQQFADRHVRQFIRRLERPTASARHTSIKTLIADGAELQQRLRVAREHQIGDPGRNEALCTAVRPYLQLVGPGVRDEHTRILLRDIWRYFRFTWSIPQTPIPGTQPPLPGSRCGARAPRRNRDCRTQQLRRANGSARPRHRLERLRTHRRPDDAVRPRRPEADPRGQRTRAPHARHLPVAAATVPGWRRAFDRGQARGTRARRRLAP